MPVQLREVSNEPANCNPKPPCPNSGAEAVGVPDTEANRSLYAMCCGGDTNCKDTSFTIIEAFLTVKYCGLHTFNLNNLKPGVDYCPSSETINNCNDFDGSNKFLVINAMANDDAFGNKTNDGYKQHMIGCGGEPISKQPNGLPSPNDDRKIPGFPLIVRLDSTVGGQVIIKDNSNNSFPVNNNQPIGPIPILSLKIPKEKNCIQTSKNNADACKSLGLPIIPKAGSKFGSADCQIVNKKACNIESCFKDIETKKYADNDEIVSIANVDAYIATGGRLDERSNPCVNNDNVQLHITRSDDPNGNDVINLHIIIGDDFPENPNKLPEVYRLKGTNVYKRIINDCTDYNEFSTCALSIAWVDEPPTTPEGYTLFATHTCNDALKASSTELQINKECKENIPIGYCCIGPEITLHPKYVSGNKYTLLKTNIEDCCLKTGIYGGEWYGDISNDNARVRCQPKVLCCEESVPVGLCVYSFQSNNVWTYNKTIVTGNSLDQRKAQCKALVSGAYAGPIVDKNEYSIYVDSIVNPDEVNIVDINNTKIIFGTDMKGAPTKSSEPDKWNNEKWKGNRDAYIDASLRGLLEATFIIYKDVTFSTRNNDGIWIPDEKKQPHIDFNGRNGTLKLIKSPETFDGITYKCNLSSSQKIDDAFFTAAEVCTKVKNGKVVATETLANTSNFTCEKLNINCANQAPIPVKPTPPTPTPPALPTPEPAKPAPEPDPKKPPEKQPRRCGDITITLNGSSKIIRIAFPYTINEVYEYNDNGDPVFRKKSFDTAESLLSYISEEYNNSRSIPKDILDLIGATVEDVVAGDINSDGKIDDIGAILDGDTNFTYSFNGSYNDCGDKPAADAPQPPPVPTKPIDPDNPPESQECICVNITMSYFTNRDRVQNLPTRKVKFPIPASKYKPPKFSTGDGVINSATELDDYLRGYIITADIPSKGKIDANPLDNTVTQALGFNEVQNSAGEFLIEYKDCDCADTATPPPNPRAPTPKPRNPSSQPNKTTLAQKKQRLEELEKQVENNLDKIQEYRAEFDRLAKYWTEKCTGWFPNNYLCTAQGRIVIEAWYKTWPLPDGFPKQNIYDATNNPKGFWKPSAKLINYHQVIEQQKAEIAKLKDEIAAIEGGL